MTKPRDFVDDIESYALPEFGNFRATPETVIGIKVIDVKKIFKHGGGDDIFTVRRIVSIDEINSSVLSARALARLTMDSMNEEMEKYKENLEKKYVPDE